MSTAARRWAKGCGCGCGALLILVGLLGWGGYAAISSIVQEAEKAEEVTARLQEEVGRVSDFQPSPDGSLSPDRMEAFLQVREAMEGARTRTAADLSLLSPGDSGTPAGISGLLGRLVSWGVGVSRVQAGAQLPTGVIGFVSARGEALLEAGMGPGEYLYIYALAYYVLLGKSPADGPAFRIAGGDSEGEQQGRSGQDEFDVREGRREAVLVRVNEMLLPALRRQLAALEERNSPAEADPWRARLEAEIAALESDRFRIPWRDGLPAPIEASIAPYRARLEASYSAMCNSLEILTGSDE